MNFPPVILSLGLPRSGSTWVYNAARLLLNNSDKRYQQYFSDSLSNIQNITSESDSLFLVKSHTADMELRDAAILSGKPILISVRDPRDAVASAVTFTKARFEVMLDLICSSAEIILSCIEYDCALTFRYEDAYMENPATIASIAKALGIAPDARVFANIFAVLRADAVREEISRSIEDGIFGPNPDSSKFDPVSQWHPNHIADGRVGKFVDMLTPDQVMEVSRRLEKFMTRFYPES